MYYFYILRCADGTLYCGQTNDLMKRVQEHNSGTVRGAKYTRGRRPVTLIHSEQFKTVGEAMRRELEVKRFKRADKLLLAGKSLRDP